MDPAHLEYRRTGRTLATIAPPPAPSTSTPATPPVQALTGVKLGEAAAAFLLNLIGRPARPASAPPQTAKPVPAPIRPAPAAGVVPCVTPGDPHWGAVLGDLGRP